MVDGIAEDVRGAPWFHVLTHAQTISEGLSYAFGPDEETYSFAVKTMLTALLERMGAKPRPVIDPFQAVIYSECSRKDFRKAAHQYIRNAGGRDAVQARCEAWLAEHPNDAGPRAFGIPGFDLGKVEPRGPDDAVRGLLEKAEDTARESMKETSEVSPMLLMETRGGKQLALALKNPNGRLSELIPTLRNFAQGQDAHAGAILFEAWVAPADGEVRASKSDQRREVVMIVGIADQICTTRLFNIDRSDDDVTLIRDEDVNDTGNPTPWAALFDDAVWEELSTPRN
jgi:hypothetical protein